MDRDQLRSCQFGPNRGSRLCGQAFGRIGTAQPRLAPVTALVTCILLTPSYYLLTE